MGFDLFMVRKPQKAVGYEPELPDRPEWFRFSWRGMEAVYEGMQVARILEDKTPQPVLPPRGAITDAELESLRATQSSLGDRVPHWKFTSNEGWLVSPPECKIISSRLNHCLETNPGILRPKDLPESKPLDGFHQLLREWIAFNVVASTHGGYNVR